jgi:hypothetical protein
MLRRIVQGLVANSRESTRPDMSGTGVNHTGVCDERRVLAMVASSRRLHPPAFSMVAFGASKADSHLGAPSHLFLPSQRLRLPFAGAVTCNKPTACDDC